MSAARARVVLVPGLGLEEADWARVRPLLPAAHQVLLLPALGSRPRRGTDLDAESQAARVLAGLHRDGAGPVVLVGHSASCPVLVEVARRSSDVRGLVLVGPITDPRGRDWPHVLGRWVRTAVHERLWEVPVLVPQYTRTGYLRSIVAGMNALRRYPTHAGLAGVSVPVAVVRGQHDAICPAPWAALLAEAPGREVVTIPGGGHMVPLTHPEEVASAVTAVARRG